MFVSAPNGDGFSQQHGCNSSKRRSKQKHDIEINEINRKTPVKSQATARNELFVSAESHVETHIALTSGPPFEHIHPPKARFAGKRGHGQIAELLSWKWMSFDQAKRFVYHVYVV